MKGMSPAQVDDSELWQIAAVLGFHRPAPEPINLDADPGPDMPPPVRSPRGIRRRARARAGLPTDTIRQRMLHAQDPDRYPAPTPKPASYNAAGFGIMGGRPGVSFGDQAGEVTGDAD